MNNNTNQSATIPGQEFTLGRKFINNKNVGILIEDIHKAQIIFLFFSSLWCNPCQEFVEELWKFYNKVNESMKTLEVIHVSFDRSEEDFNKDIADKPWVFIPYNDPIIKDIALKYSVNHIPTIILLNKDYSVASDTVRKDMSEQGIRIVDKWIKLVNLTQN